MCLICPTIMINPIDYIHKYPHRTGQILGISYKQFLQLVQQATLRQNQERQRIKQTKMRINNTSGGGRKPILSTESEVALCLFYLRHLPTFEILGLGSRCQKYCYVFFLGSVGSYKLSVWFEDCQYFLRQYSRQFGISKTSANDI